MLLLYIDLYFPMSQSDYLKRKRVATVLYNDSTLYPVFSEKNLLDFKQYSLENTIVNSKPTTNRIVPSNKQVVFGIQQTVSSCPTFTVCSGTNTRPNRVPLTGVLCQPVPLNWRDRKTAANAKCRCALNRSETSDYQCMCSSRGYIMHVA